MTKRVAILISGGGSNMEALVRSMQGDHPARAVLVFSNVEDAGGLAKAQGLGVPTAALDHRTFGADRAAFDRAVNDILEDAAPDIVCLAGYMRILTPAFVEHWAGRMINIHPSLLPKYKGLHTHQRALDAGDTEHGCSVHEVTADLDGGPLLGQAHISIEPGDTAETLAARLLPFEHELFVKVLRRYAKGEKAFVTLG